MVKTTHAWKPGTEPEDPAMEAALAYLVGDAAARGDAFISLTLASAEQKGQPDVPIVVLVATGPAALKLSELSELIRPALPAGPAN